MDAQKYKVVISDAIKSEIAAKEFYEKIALKVKDDYLKELFGEFAKEEEKHERILSAIIEKGSTKTSFFNFDKDFKVSETIAMPEVNEDMNLKDAIGLAVKNEELAMLKYTALADNCEDDELKKVFLDLASMERNHKFKMEQSFVDVAYPEAW